MPISALKEGQVCHQTLECHDEASAVVVLLGFLEIGRGGGVFYELNNTKGSAFQFFIIAQMNTTAFSSPFLKRPVNLLYVLGRKDGSLSSRNVVCSRTYFCLKGREANCMLSFMPAIKLNAGIAHMNRVLFSSSSNLLNPRKTTVRHTTDEEEEEEEEEIELDQRSVAPVYEMEKKRQRLLNSKKKDIRNRDVTEAGDVVYGLDPSTQIGSFEDDDDDDEEIIDNKDVLPPPQTTSHPKSTSKSILACFFLYSRSISRATK